MLSIIPARRMPIGLESNAAVELKARGMGMSPAPGRKATDSGRFGLRARVARLVDPGRDEPNVRELQTHGNEQFAGVYGLSFVTLQAPVPQPICVEISCAAARSRFAVRPVREVSKPELGPTIVMAAAMLPS